MINWTIEQTSDPKVAKLYHHGKFIGTITHDNDFPMERKYHVNGRYIIDSNNGSMEMYTIAAGGAVKEEASDAIFDELCPACSSATLKRKDTITLHCPNCEHEFKEGEQA